MPVELDVTIITVQCKKLKQVKTFHLARFQNEKLKQVKTTLSSTKNHKSVDRVSEMGNQLTGNDYCLQEETVAGRVYRYTIPL